MNASTSALKNIFGRDVQYIVPLYQRPYVWTEDDQWQPLWEDVEVVVRQLLHGAVSSDGVLPVDSTPPHFLGAIVLDQQRNRTGSIEQRYIIDGQQRLTTLQLLLAAASKVANRRGLEREARLLQALTRNNPDLMADDVDKFKVWPTNIDRNAFVAAMESAGDASETEDDPFNLIQEAHTFFFRAIDEWAESEIDVAASIEDRFNALVQVLRDLIQIVVIDLEVGDNAQVIFETLNARGTPLLAIDLVKNLIFYKAQQAGEDVEGLYRRYWHPFEQSYWREAVRQGRLHRARAEIFLMHWLTMKTQDEVGAHHLYDSFRSLLKTQGEDGSGPLLAEFSDDGRLFQSFDFQPAGSRLQAFFANLRALDTATVLPLVLFLFRQDEQTLPFERRLRAIAALESWLVRRMLCGLTPKNYNRFVVDLLQLMAPKLAEADSVLVEALTRATAETNVWPSNERLFDALRSMPLYGRLNQPRVRLILGSVELAMRSEKSEEISLPTGLTIEHVLPQSWREHWPVEPAGDIARELERERHVHLLGNLTLASGRLNPDLSNAAWPEKRHGLNEHSVLMLNRKLVEEHPESWDESTIDNRSQVLADYIARIWRGPEDDWSSALREDSMPTSDVMVEAPSSPEQLIERHGLESARKLMFRFVEELSYWPDVKVWPGGSTEERWRPIHFSRHGSTLGAFCVIGLGTARLRFRLTPEDAPFTQIAEPRQAQGPYLLQLHLTTDEAYGEAIRLARLAYDRSFGERS